MYLSSFLFGFIRAYRTKTIKIMFLDKKLLIHKKEFNIE